MSDGNREQSPWKQIRNHWIVGVLAGAGVSYQGPHDITIRCMLFVLLCIWLSAETWVSFRGWKTPKIRYSTTILLIAILCLLTAVAVRGTYYGDIRQKQHDVFKNIVLKQEHQDDPTDPFTANFSVTNNSDSVILRNLATCVQNYVHYQDGLIVSRGEVSDDQAEIFRTQLAANGGSETFKCEAHHLDADTSPLLCADITIRFDYWDDIQPNMSIPKSYRFFARQEKDGFNWHSEPLNVPRGGCAD